MKKLNLIKIGLFLIILPILMTSCRTPMRFTYTAQNLKGNAVMDEENMLADYGKFSILYTAFGGVTIINKSDSILYIDMAESYYVNNGTAQQLYTNAVTTHFSSSSRGTSINLGSITNTLGIGGAVGTLAQGINVNGGKTSGTSTEIREERYVSIPPMSHKIIKSVFFEPLFSGKWNDYKNTWPDAIGSFFVKKGSYNYTPYSSPMHEYVFSYSFDQNAKFQSTRDLFYVSRIDIRKSLRHESGKGNQVTKKKQMTAGDYLKTMGICFGSTIGIGLLIESLGAF